MHGHVNKKGPGLSPSLSKYGGISWNTYIKIDETGTSQTIILVPLTLSIPASVLPILLWSVRKCIFMPAMEAFWTSVLVGNKTPTSRPFCFAPVKISPITRRMDLHVLSQRLHKSGTVKYVLLHPSRLEQRFKFLLYCGKKSKWMYILKYTMSVVYNLTLLYTEHDDRI